jgi:hypothetical protein
MTSRSRPCFEDEPEPRRPHPLDEAEPIGMGACSVTRLERIVTESRSQEERDYHEARWDQIFGN